MSASIFSRIAVVGAGAWGTALALAAARADREVMLWSRDSETSSAIRDTGMAPRLPGIKLPSSITPTNDLAALADCRAFIIAVPTQVQREVLEAMALVLPAGKPVISAAKGIERSTGQFVTEVILDAWPGAVPAILSGPSFAEDVGRGLPTAVTLAAGDAFLAQALAEALSSPAFRIYHSADLRGVEIGGATKNVLAIAAGISIGLGFGESARAALVARGFAEIRRFGSAFGAQGDTLMGLSGLGDLVLTCGSAQSRNFAFGKALGEGRSVAEASGGKLAEGAFTAQVLVTMAKARGIDMPIAAGIDDVVAGRAKVREAVAGLLARPVRSES
ncbi:MAG: NAD(P)H-dependent glycerol-3-phosphate dehydrogenase [Bosea sp. (in: a-proteobacteria)]